jgi:nitrate reductase gamma subunit
MNEVDFLLWVKGPAFTVAVVIFVAGLVLRLFEILSLGRKHNFAVAKGDPMKGGLREMWRRSIPADKATFNRSLFTIVAGYVFHIGLFVVILLLAAHIALIKSVIGFGWPNLSTPVVDAFAVMTMIALLAVLWHRLRHPVKRFLSKPGDYVVWAVTFLPLLTGYMAYHHLLLSPQLMLALHILSVELLLVLFPFTKLMHTFTLFLSRWYNGAAMGMRGVKS